jgi:predicted DNA-binding transcriptional regulator YafY
MGARQVGSRFVRMWSIMGEMQSHSRGIAAGQLEKLLQISRATLQRDLKILRESPLPIATERVNGEMRYLVSEEAFNLPRLSSRMRAALTVARRFLAPLEGTEAVSEIDAFLDLSAKEADLPLSASDTAARHNPRHARVIEQALRAQRPVRLSYQGATRRSKDRIVEPVDLRHHDGHLYVLAWDVAKKTWRTFKVARIQKVELIADAVCTHPPFEADAIFAHAVGVWSAEASDVRIRVSPEAALLVREHPLSPKARVTEEADGSLVVEARVAGLVEAKAWVLRWGRRAEVLGPPALRTAIHEEHAAAARLYRRHKVSHPR